MFYSIAHDASRCSRCTFTLVYKWLAPPSVYNAAFGAHCIFQPLHTAQCSLYIWTRYHIRVDTRLACTRACALPPVASDSCAAAQRKMRGAPSLRVGNLGSQTSLTLCSLPALSRLSALSGCSQPDWLPLCPGRLAVLAPSPRWAGWAPSGSGPGGAVLVRLSFVSDIGSALVQLSKLSFISRHPLQGYV